MRWGGIYMCVCVLEITMTRKEINSSIQNYICVCVCRKTDNDQVEGMIY